jgi:hypothetical protein
MDTAFEVDGPDISKLPCRTFSAVNRRVICALIALAPGRGEADGIAIIGGSPRAIGRAGAATVGDDGGGALLINPAAMARRDTLRAQLGAAVVEDDLHWQSCTDGAPQSAGQGGSSFAPIGAGIGGFGDWVLGAGMLTSGVSQRVLPRPDGTDPLGDDFDYRYVGISGSYRRDTISVGAARRIGSSLALGLALGASRVRVSEHRRIWAGIEVNDVGDPASDVDVELSATDQFTPSAVAGLLYAPEDAPIELGASAAWSGTARLDGTVSAAPGAEAGPEVAYTAARGASLVIPQPITVRVGGRYVGDRVVAELDGDLWIARAGSQSPAWAVTGVDLIHAVGGTKPLQRLPSRISQHTHVALRTAVDVALMPGFLWATAGYAYANRATPAAYLSPSFGDLGGHTLGFGLEATSGGATVSLGWSRTWSNATNAPNNLNHDNPFGVDVDMGMPGTYDAAVDQVGILVEVELATSP